MLVVIRHLGPALDRHRGALCECTSARLPMQRHAGDYEANAGKLGRAGDLAKHDEAYRRGGGGKQSEQQSEGLPRQASHGELIADIGDDGSGYAYADARAEQQRVGEGGRGVGDADREGGDHRDEHGGAQAVDALACGGDAVAQDDVEDKQGAVGEGEDVADWLVGDPDIGEDEDAGDGEGERGEVLAGAHAGGGEANGAQELDRSDGAEGRRAIAK